MNFCIAEQKISNFANLFSRCIVTERSENLSAKNSAKYSVSPPQSFDSSFSSVESDLENQTLNDLFKLADLQKNFGTHRLQQ